MPIFSFDVFDTCVTRCYSKPTDIFEPLFTQLLASAACPTHHLVTAAKTLAQQRILAERAAHKHLSPNKTKREEIEMIDIYQRLAPQLAHYGLSAHQAMSAEIELELSILSPILSTQLQIKNLRAQGHQIGFISDMYLPTTVVHQILEKNGFFEPEDFLYVSSDVGYTKGSGNLFRHVCDQLKITPKQLHHTGDNFYADVRAANKAGSRWTYFKPGNPNRYESADRLELFASTFHQPWNASYLVGLSRAIRLQYDNGSPLSRQQAMLSANILAPLLAGYIFSIVHTALQANIQQLYYTDSLSEKLSAIAKDTLLKHINHTAPGHSLQFLPHPTASIPATSTNPTPHHTGQQTYHYSPGTLVEASRPTSDDPSSDRAPHANPPTPAKQSLCFSLLPTSPTPTLQPAVAEHLHHTYLSLPTSLQSTSHKFPHKFAPLVTHRHVIETLLQSLNRPQTEAHWQAITQYSQHLATHYLATHQTQPFLSHDSQLTDSLNGLKRYAVSNLIQFLHTPTPEDATALLSLAAANISTPNQQASNQKTKTIASPIRLHQLPQLLKQTVKRSQPNSHNTILWIEGSLSLSPWPIKQLSNKLLQPSKQLYQYLLIERPLWFYKPIMHFQALRKRHHK